MKYLISILILMISFPIYAQKDASPFQKNSSIFQWWERYYPENQQATGKLRLTHVEFFQDNNFRYNVVAVNKDQSGMSTVNCIWKPDAQKPNTARIYTHPNLEEEYFEINILSFDKKRLVLTTTYYPDTIYMKPSR